MDFKLVTSTVLKAFEQQQISYAVIGGFALGFWGVTRATIDMDFLLLVDDAGKVDRILGEHGYRIVYKSENVAQYVSSVAAFGNVDIIFAFREISRSMLARSETIELSADLTIKSLIPEDIIGLKLQALVNDPDRESKDGADIEALLSAKLKQGKKIDWELLRDYFDLFNRRETFDRLKFTYDKLNEREKRELLEDAASDARRVDFEMLDQDVSLEPNEFIAFLDWAYPLLSEKHEDRNPSHGYIPALTGWERKENASFRLSVQGDAELIQYSNCSTGSPVPIIYVDHGNAGCTTDQQ